MALRRIASAFGKLGAAAVIAAVFAFGLLATVYLSIRSPEIQVPEVVNKSYSDGEATLEQAGLDIRERAQRYKSDVQPGIILDQSPRAGEIIKAGQTIAVVVSRGPREGEQPPPADEDDAGEKNDNSKANENAAANSNKNENTNRERPKNTNRNTNRNANANSTANLNGNRNNSNNTRNANTNANRGANANRSLNTNANANRPRTTNSNARNSNSAAPRNTSPARPAANANRRP
ncbi:MAG TPA: PASTA domain-containing protein [Pyrinomonadaceae bacterium]|nr:PASTA domain-containing protein [Pyrinomonadaceae bacterium]